MNKKGLKYLLIAIGALFVAISAFALSATPVKAQCGSQASSCKNCHETQAQDPVNADGTAWHTQHAFGDFCYLCHAGNNQATDKTAAHVGLVAPLSDINASCKSCHTADTQAKAQVYATTLGIQIGTRTGSNAPAPAAATAAPADAQNAGAAAPAAVVPAADMVDYSQTYAAVVEGKQPANLGNIILLGLLAVMVLGGGFFVLKREGFVNIRFDNPRKVAVDPTFSADVVEMLPEISKLKPESRKALQNILAKPQVAADLFTSIDRYARKDENLGETDVEDDGSDGSEPSEPVE